MIIYLKDFIAISACLDYMITNDEQLIFRCFECKKDYKKELIKRFANIYEFCNKDINKFVLLLRKGVCPYESMDSWEIFIETSLPEKKAFYSNLHMEDIRVIHYCLQMYLKILETCALKYIN